MVVSTDIVKKIKLYQDFQSKADEIYAELAEYFVEEQGLEGFLLPFIADNPKGDIQFQIGKYCEYCDQITLGEGCYKGEYYYPIEDSDKYVGCSYEI